MELNDYLKALGLSYDELHEDERQVYQHMYDVMYSNPLTPEGIKDSVVKMREEVCALLVDTKITDKEDQQLKARLKNYMMLEAMLKGPEEAKKAYERMMQQRITNRK